MIQVFQHKDTHVTKAVFYLCYVDVHDNGSKQVLMY